MSEEELFADLGKRLVIGRKRDGRSVYDPQAKAELIRACRGSDLSVARIARGCGVNANQLATWVRRDDRERAGPQMASLSFVPVTIDATAIQPTATEPPLRATLDLQARLPNGVALDLCGVELQHVGELFEALGRLRCSASTKA